MLERFHSFEITFVAIFTLQYINVPQSLPLSFLNFLPNKALNRGHRPRVMAMEHQSEYSCSTLIVLNIYALDMTKRGGGLQVVTLH